MQPQSHIVSRLFLSLALPALLVLACTLGAEAPAMLNLARPTPTLPAQPTPEIPAVSAPLGTRAGRPIDPGLHSLMDSVEADRLMFTVDTLVNFGTRHVLSAKDDPQRGIGAARDWLLRQFSTIRDAHPTKAIQVWTQPMTFAWRDQQVVIENVVAVFPGTEIGAGVYLIGAHYDSIGTPPWDGSAPAPGAVDNASGVAALLEIAQVLGPLPHRATLMFVAFSAEESGRQGSEAFVQHYLLAQMLPVDVRGMINLDMIGTSRGPGNQIDPRTLRLFSAEPNGSPSRQLARQLALLISTYSDEVSVVLQSAEERTGRWGDQQSFSAAGYPSVRFIQGLEDPSRQHNARDNLEYIDPAYLLRTTRAVLAGITALATGPLPPHDLRLRPVAADIQALNWIPVPQAASYVVALRRATSLGYDQVFTTDIASVTWNAFEEYEVVAVAAVDSAGRIGRFTEEIALASLVK